MIIRRRPSALMLRWPALGAAAGAALTMALETLGVPGPWQAIALVLALLAVLASVGVSVRLHQGVRELEAADERLRQDELALGELQRELEERTKLEQELRQAKNAAESAVMAKGEFLATMSHEIRTPLNGITPMLDLLMHAPLAPDHAELVRTAFLSSQQMQRIVDDILDYSKLESDKLELETTAFHLRELLDGVTQLMERPAQSKGLRIGLQVDPSVRLPVRGDPVRLRQVLGNLISNAVKFTDRGSITITVRRLGESAGQHQLRFEVRDTGIGIAPSAQARLFQAFSQADASTTRLYGGTGLGLAISRRIVELMGGRIGVESEPGAGATFWFEIPLLKAQGDMPVDDAAPRDGRALLLSADPRLRLRLSMLLPNWGLRVSAVETTQEALDRLRTAANQGAPWAYSLVVADLSGMRNTAVALYRNITRQAAYGDLRLVCLYGDEPVAEELRQGATLLSRQAPDADLREAVLDLPPATAASAVATAAEPIPAPAAPRIAPLVSTAAEIAEIATDHQRTAAPRKPRVLLVEDNPVNLMVGQRLLSVLGISCDTASNGEAALIKIADARFDIVLMDCQMPVMDGYTATRRWREHEAASDTGRRLPIIAMTANAMAGDRQKCLDAGMDDYLAKPVTRSELERCLHRWWDPQALPASAPDDDADTPADEHAHPAWTVAPVIPAVEESVVAPPPPAIVESTHGSGPAIEDTRPAAPTPALVALARVEPIAPAPVALAMPEAVHAHPAPTPAAFVAPEAVRPSPSLSPPPAPVVPEAVAPRPAPPAPIAAPMASVVAPAAPRPAAASPSSAPTPAPATGEAATPARPPEALPPVIDPDVLDDLRALLGDEVDRLIDVFLEDTPRLLATLENAVDGPDYSALREAAHSLKSSSANLGAMSLSAAARRIEAGARERELPRPAVAVALVTNEFARVRRALRENRQPSPAP
ncbi:ATP-binding protein [Luteimonas sp. WGS1318]|uniref:ATP-binding protein n=1 Tax=Luteimonas sp. WGS1318 TaxID=3366815 RepID=UPI00372D196F